MCSWDLNQADQAPDLHNACIQLATLLVGDSVEADHSSIDTFEAWLRYIVDNGVKERFSAILRPEFPACSESHARVIWLLCEVAEQLRRTEEISIKRIIAVLTGESVLRESASSKDKTRCIFASVGWLTMLYKPGTSEECEPLTMAPGRASYFLSSTLNIRFAQRSIAEMLRNYGDILPMRKTIDASGPAEAHPQALQVASLNVATLKRVANVKIEWVDEISGHLDFQPSTLALKLLRFPSFCHLHMADKSVLSKYVTTKTRRTSTDHNSVLTRYYDDAQKPEGFTVGNYMREILLSYSLLFRFDSNAQKIYYNKERKRAGADGHRDPLLDELCMGRDVHTSLRLLYWLTTPVKESFDAASDFPILSSRLSLVQKHIDSIQPNRISSLWRDKRDIMRWYTFWAVVILGGFNILIAMVQAALSAAQVKLGLQTLRQGH